MLFPFFPFDAVLVAAAYAGMYLATHVDPFAALIICVVTYFLISRSFALFCLLGVLLWRISQLEKQTAK